MSEVPADRRSGPTPTLDALLEARERRVARRDAAFDAGAATVIVVTPVMPGPVKDCGIARDVQGAALAALDRMFASNRWRAKTLVTEVTATGAEAIVAVSADARDVKRATIAIEESHPLGRLFDLDVAGREGAVARRDLGLGPRRCFLCERPAHACARSRTHSLDDLLAVMEERLDATHVDASDHRG